MASAIGIPNVAHQPISKSEQAIWLRLLMQLFVVAVVFLNGADFLGKTGEDEFVVHWQVLLRLAVCGCCGVIGLFRLFPHTYQDFLTWPGILISLYVIWNGVSVVFSQEQMYSLAAWVSMFCVVLFIPAAMRVLGGYRLLLTVGFATTLFLVGSWFAFKYYPEVGIWKEKITQSDVVERMGGLGHPNELGVYSMYTVLVVSALLQSGRLNWKIAVPIIVLGFVTLVGCFSRTSMIATMVGLPFVFRKSLLKPGNVFGVIFAIAAFALIAFFVIGSGRIDWMIEDALLKITKSGSTEELTSATGRTEIWAFGISKIIESPIVGYGYCTSRFVMVDYSYHCHNMILNSAIYSGIFTGVVVLIHTGYLGICAFLRSDYAIDGMAMAMLAAGLVESLIAAPAPAINIFMYMMLIFWRQMHLTLDRPNARATLQIQSP
ncbi:MAG: O-antigen ligase family protein [Pirellulaceae bacterium]